LGSVCTEIVLGGNKRARPIGPTGCGRLVGSGIAVGAGCGVTFGIARGVIFGVGRATAGALVGRAAGFALGAGFDGDDAALPLGGVATARGAAGVALGAAVLEADFAAGVGFGVGEEAAGSADTGTR
jgi:hypothetical protein